MNDQGTDVAAAEVLLRRMMGGMLTVVGVAALYIGQIAAMFLLPELGGRLIHAAIYYPWTQNLLSLIPLLISFVVAVHAPKGTPLILRTVGLRLVSRSGAAEPSARQRILRWLLLVLTVMLAGLPLAVMFLRADRRAVHDVFSGTNVTWTAGD
ncbi:MAG: RDD family protein [Actinobacteria bacterium]|nr:RDD family protein [Actinomycetota bacterium]